MEKVTKGHTLFVRVYFTASSTSTRSTPQRYEHNSWFECTHMKQDTTLESPMHGLTITRSLLHTYASISQISFCWTLVRHCGILYQRYPQCTRMWISLQYAYNHRLLNVFFITRCIIRTTTRLSGQSEHLCKIGTSKHPTRGQKTELALSKPVWFTSSCKAILSVLARSFTSTSPMTDLKV